MSFYRFVKSLSSGLDFSVIVRYYVVKEGDARSNSSPARKRGFD